MAMTFEELLDALKRLDEMTLLELLEVSSEEIVEKFRDEIEENYDYFYGQVKEDESDSQGIAD